jgi:hemerythrin
MIPQTTETDWQQDLGTGVEEVDVEHQLQIQLVQSLHEAVAASRPAPLLAELLTRLEDTSNVHFMSEELLMRLHSWERYDLHTEEHRRLLEELQALRKIFEREDRAELSAAVERLKGWLSSHIRGMDRAFATYVSRGGLGGGPEGGPASG